MNVVILGGGIAGLLAARAFKRFKPVMLEGADMLGGNYLKGGLKYIRQTTLFTKLLDDLDISWHVRLPVGLIHINGQIEPHPSWFIEQSPERRERIQQLHWERTRGTTHKATSTCLNNPFGNGSDPLLDCDLKLLMERLIKSAYAHGSVHTGVQIQSIHPGHVAFQGATAPYDVLVPTIPLAALSALAGFAALPRGEVRLLTIVDMMSTDGDPTIPCWDYMYNFDGLATRYTWQGPGHFQAEIPDKRGDETHMNKVLGESLDILAPFTSGLQYKQHAYIPGHLLPLERSIDWPATWRPLGRFTEWDPRATAEAVFGKAMIAAKEV